MRNKGRWHNVPVGARRWKALGALALLLWPGSGIGRAGAATPGGDLPAPVPLSSGWQLQDAAKVAEGGDAVSRSSYRPAAWYKATVPGTVLTSLVNDGVYPEPLYGENNRPDVIPDSLCRTAYWYRTRFSVPRSFAGRRVRLNFDGINYTAAVWVNGHHLGGIRGAFARGMFDVTPFVTRSGPNVLAVQILPPPHPGIPLEQTQANGTGRNGGILTIDGPTFLSTLGWDWIPGIRDRDMGIWQGVTLSATGPVTVQDPYVTSDLPLPRTDTADLTVQATLRNTTNRPQSGLLIGTFGATTFRRPVTLTPAETRSVTLSPADTPALRVRHPRLWWPNGYGPQNLYTMRLRFVANGAVSDGKDTQFGIREITYAVPGSDNLTLVVNGVPVIAKGGNWGIDEAMKRSPRKRLDAQVRMHKLANYTIIRNWVGQSTGAEFYDLCDRYGILIWDEFFQPNPSDGPNVEDTALYLANVREKVLRFRSHPCIALWCGRNEGNPAPAAVSDGIQALMSELERNRLYQPSSTDGRGVHSGGPYRWRTPREYYTVDAPFKTELGSVSVPTLEAVEGMMPRKDWWPINDDWAAHDMLRGAQAGDRYMVTQGTRYGPFAGLPDFVRKAQMANYESYRAMYEGRFAQLFQPTTGVITWMSNPAQPSFVWQLYSYDLEPNAALYATRKACEPVHVMMNETNGHLMVINNTPRAVAGIAAAYVYNLDGTARRARSVSTVAAPSAATDLGEISFPAGLSPVHFVKVTLTDAHGRRLSDNFYWRADPAHPDDFTALNALPPVALSAAAARRDSAGRCRMAVTLHNPTNAVALMAHLQLRRARSGARVLPVFYSDNYVSLLPGESRTVTVDAAAADLGGEEPSLAVDGWNVTVRQPAASGGAAVRIVPNETQ